MPPPKFIFCHIPKVAGTLFSQILQRNFGKKFYPYYGLWDNRFFTKEDVAGMCDLHPQYDCIASHMFSLDLPFDSKHLEIRAICFVRDPVERALSLYFYSYRMAKLNPGYKPPGSMEAFFESLLRGHESRRFCDGQYRFLCGNIPEAISIESIGELAKAGKLLIAPLERFDDACLGLELCYPDVFKNTAYGQRRNVASRGEEVPNRIRQLLVEKNQVDLKLYEAVKRYFDSWYSSKVNTIEQYAKLRCSYIKRCRNFRLRDQIWRWIKRINLS